MPVIGIAGPLVSIHASAREATGLDCIVIYGSVEFQSTPPHGRRPGLDCIVIYGSVGFNPRLRTGGDPGPGSGMAAAGPVSIHASAREATQRGFRSWRF